MKTYYTDGSGSNQKTRCGGWAYALIDNNSIIKYASGSEEDTTNNRMELQAVLEAMKDADKFDTIIIYTDSAYIANAFKDKWYVNWRRNGWITSKKSPVLNKDLWIEILKFYDLGNFSIEKVKGHSTTFGNNLVDRLAVDARKTLEGQIQCPELISLF